MSEFRIAYRYAKSLIDLGVEKSNVEKLNDDVMLFGKTVSDNRDLALLLKSPIIPSTKKLKVVNTIFEGKVEEMFSSFLNIVFRKGREAYLLLMTKEFGKLYNELKGIQKANVTTTFELDNHLKKEFSDAVSALTSGKEVELEEKVEEELIGGFILKLGDRQIDASISNRLKNLKRNLIDQS
ncbi:MAG: ATP synthase F1 subunit delta [Bacteroidota bacterium]